MAPTPRSTLRKKCRRHCARIPAIEPLIIMGLLTDDDIKAIKSQDALRDASDDELMAELGRRIKASSEDPKWQQPPKVE